MNWCALRSSFRKRRLMGSPYRAELESRFGPQAFALWEADLTTYDPAMAPPFRFGFMYDCRRVPGSDLTMTDVYAATLDHAVLADQLGFEYRVVDTDRWTAWLQTVTGYDDPQIEVVKRTLRVADQGKPENAPTPSTWQYGTGPTQRAVEAAGAALTTHPARMSPPDPKTAPAPVPVQAVPPVMPRPAPEPITPVRWEPEKTAPATVETPVPDKTIEPAADPLTERIVNLVADQTGYPADMLDLDLDLEADLGIDTVKQAETFAEKPPQVDDLVVALGTHFASGEDRLPRPVVLEGSGPKVAVDAEVVGRLGVELVFRVFPLPAAGRFQQAADLLPLVVDPHHDPVQLPARTHLDAP